MDRVEERRGRPTKAESARYGKLPDGWEDNLVKGAVTALVQGNTHFTLKVHHLTRLPSPLTRGIKTEEWPCYKYRLNARKVLKWLNAQGYSSVSTEDLRIMQLKLTLMEKDLFSDP